MSVCWVASVDDVVEVPGDVLEVDQLDDFDVCWQRAVNRFGQRAQLRRRVLNAVDPRVGVQVEEPRHVLADAVGEVRRIGVGLGRAPPGASSSPFLS